MSHISVFLNTKIHEVRPSFDSPVVAFGNWCLTPVRCLCHGNTVTIAYKENTVSVTHTNELRNCLRVIVSIILILPGLILGSIFKGLGYLSEPIRQQHCYAVKHFSPIKLQIGTPERRASLKEIETTLHQHKDQENPYNRPLHLIIYAQENCNPSIDKVLYQKIIMA